MIVELWRLPDKQVTWMDGSTHFIRQVAYRDDTWINFYQVLPGHTNKINTIPDGSVPLILDGEWVT